MLKNKLKNKKKKGFTLIELIVVLAVLAIIALIAIPNFNQIRENSKIKSDQRGADLIDKAVTTLVLDGSVGDGVYQVQGNVITPTSGADGSKIQGVLEDPKVQQDIANKYYTITISASKSKDPIVNVNVDTYNSDTPTS